MENQSYYLRNEETGEMAEVSKEVFEHFNQAIIPIGDVKGHVFFMGTMEPLPFFDVDFNGLYNSNP